MQDEPIQIFTDGACQGNPGPGGWGVLIIYPDGKRQELCGGEAATTNNRMEMLSAIRALEFLEQPANIRLSSDSQYLIRGINEWLANWKKRGWRTASGGAVKNIDLWQALDAQLLRHQIEWCWVRGHNGHPCNERADKLARQGVPTHY